MESTLYAGGALYAPAEPQATALLVQDGRIAWLGPTADAPAADVTVDLGGALVTPAFVDAHVHATDTGLVLGGLDLSAAASAGELLDAVALYATTQPADAIVMGHGWDESKWPDQTPPTAQDLARVAGGRRVYLTQASVHSALASSALLAAAPRAAGEPGFAETGWVREEAHHAVREVALGSLSTAQRERAQRTALRHAARLGIGALHECGGPGTSNEADFTGLLALAGPEHGLPEVYGWWGELMAAAKAKELGAVGAGGDLYADGALGSRTAYLREPFLGGGGCGFSYVSAEQARDHIVDCHEHGTQGGFHAIGDAALHDVLEGFAGAAKLLGLDVVRQARHRVEHAELVDKAMIAAFVELNLTASMQPAFDRLWGGPRQMYAQRLGVARSMESNPMGAMHGVGVTLAFGSDSPVTPLDPWGSVRAAVSHFNPAHRMAVRSAFAAHTKGAWRSIHRDGEGVLAKGAPATFAVWQTPAGVTGGMPNLVSPNPEERGPDDPTPLPRCLRTVVRGVTIFEE
ncbi:amidohydrolase [Asanoa iriomotensis]|uniref:Amidohydrolase n=1 Tax=Asanoa iriomotensis TaxID=234613 RepID=A0ABQ4CB86_9ACTN|nr:amidohydrolase family protein [Asanoa iriomotensis]GIF60036.1 amidohydrolase [Asanoa iriomotensis]